MAQYSSRLSEVSVSGDRIREAGREQTAGRSRLLPSGSSWSLQGVEQAGPYSPDEMQNVPAPLGVWV
jgi:hypothetical protein